MENNNNNKNKNNNGNKDGKQPKFNQTIVILMIAALFIFMGISMLNSMVKDATYKEIT